MHSPNSVLEEESSAVFIVPSVGLDRLGLAVLDDLEAKVLRAVDASVVVDLLACANWVSSSRKK